VNPVSGVCTSGVIRWPAAAVPSVARDTTLGTAPVALTYTVDLPAGVDPGRTYTNTAGVRRYQTVSNADDSPFVYYPSSNIDGTVVPNTGPATDNSTITIAAASVDKVQQSSVNDAVGNAGNASPSTAAELATIGETLADLDDPRPLPVITVDEPSLGLTIGINTSVLAGKEGKKLTARMVKDRLDQELIGNVSLRVQDTERPDGWEVQGRGELQLAVLVETMRREGFELTVGKPEVLIREIDGKRHEPVERVTIDVPEEMMGVVTQLLALRKGRMEQVVNHGTGWTRMDYLVPARGLVGFRTEFLTETRGTGLLHSVFEGWEPWMGEIRTRTRGSLVADRTGVATTFAMFGLQERGTMFVEPGEAVYEGMVVGENSRGEDMDVNITKEKKLTNMRSSTSDELERLVPPRKLSLEQALEWVRDDECVEVTPVSVRMRKVALDATTRAKMAKSRKTAAEG
jgi:GTP-binding protein